MEHEWDKHEEHRRHHHLGRLANAFGFGAVGLLSSRTSTSTTTHMCTIIMGLVSGEDDEDGTTARQRNSYCFTDLAGTIWLLSCNLVLGHFGGRHSKVLAFLRLSLEQLLPILYCVLHRYLELLRNSKFEL